jgi:hypothetical protein
MYSPLAHARPSLTVHVVVARLCDLCKAGPTKRSDSRKEPRDPREVCQECSELCAPILNRKFIPTDGGYDSEIQLYLGL